MKLFYTLIFSLFISFSFAQTFPVTVYAVTSTQPAQGGSEAANAIDGDINTIYHSLWSQVGVPDTLDFYFTADAQSIQQIIYTPRQSGPNGIWTDLDVYYTTQAQPENFILLAENIEWPQNNQAKTIDLPAAIEDVYIVRFAVNAAGGDFSSCAEMEFFSEEEYVSIENTCSISTDALTVDGINDTKIQVSANGSFASSFQNGENIGNSFDGNTATLYHSSYGNTQFPVTLNYHFDGNTAIDYLKYIPRSDGNTNGHFGSVTIQYNTNDDSNFQTLTSYNFDYAGLPTIIDFGTSITPANIQLIVEDGANNFVSCAEMEFYEKGATVNNEIPDGIFTNELCSALLPTVTQATINAIDIPFYKDLAQCLFNETYNLKYRLQNYEVFMPVQKISQTLKVGGYDQYENATGIVFSEGDKIVVFAENIPPVGTISLRVKDFAEGYEGAESFYSLKNGLNVFYAENDGLTYVSYYNVDETLPDITLNIASGKVNGYFNWETSSDNEWIELLTNNIYPKLDIVGAYTHLVYHKDALKAETPFEGKTLIDQYDLIVQHERQLMGWFKYGRNPKNRQLSLSDMDGGWYAGGTGIHLDLTWGVASVTNPYQLDLWGIPHEYGHVNQIRRDINWVGTTEVTNNIYSAWVYYQMNPNGNKYTRLEYENLQPGPNMPAEIGGRINGAINNTYVKEKALQDTGAYNDVFKVLVPFWQLELYYQVAGACKDAPLLTLDNLGTSGVDYAHWFGTVAEISRNTDSQGLSNGELLLNFVLNTCDAVEEDLTDFFIHTGFLKPIDVSIDDYGVGQLTITQTQINEVIATIQSRGYVPPVSPVINYLSAHTVDVFHDLLPLNGITGTGVTVLSDQLEIDNSKWENAVAFETYDTEGNLLHVSIKGTGDVDLTTTTIYYPTEALAVYAIGFDGEKRLVYPVTSGIPVEKTSSLSVYPNPISSNETIHLDFKGEEGKSFKASLQTVLGQIIVNTDGNIEAVEKSLNKGLKQQTAGTFLIVLSNKEETYRIKIIKK